MAVIILPFTFYVKFIFTCVLLCSGSVYSDIVDHGRTFVFAIPQFYNNPEGLLSTLTIIGRSTNTTQVKVYINEIDFTEFKVVSNHEASVINLPRLAVAEIRSGHAMTITVSSSNDISVRCIVGYQYAGHYPGEGFLVLPIASLDREYFIVTASPLGELQNTYKGKTHYALFTITAAYDNTVIKIESKVPLNVSQQLFTPPDIIRNLTLNKHKSILVSSLRDLSGTRVTANRPISVVSGNNCGIIPGAKTSTSSCYFMVEQLMPTSSWGVEFAVSPFQADTTNHVLQFAVQDKDTRVTVQDKIKRVLIPDNGTSFFQHLSGFKVVNVSSNRPIMVVHFIEKDVPSGMSGAMTVVPSVKEFARRATVVMPTPRRSYPSNESNIADFSVCIVVNCSLMNTIHQNGKLLNRQSKTVRILRGHFCSIDWRIYAVVRKTVTILSSSPMTRMYVTVKNYDNGLLDFVYPASIGNGRDNTDSNEISVEPTFSDTSTNRGDSGTNTTESSQAADGFMIFRFVWYAWTLVAGLICFIEILVAMSRKRSSKKTWTVRCTCRGSPETNTSVTDYEDFSLDQCSFHRCPSSMCSSRDGMNDRTSQSHYQSLPLDNLPIYQDADLVRRPEVEYSSDAIATDGH